MTEDGGQPAGGDFYHTIENTDCNHDWIPWGLELYSPGDLATDGGRFYRVVDIKCLYCGEVIDFRGGHTVTDAKGGGR